MFESKALGASSQPFLSDSLSSVRNRRDLSQTAIGPQRQHEQNLNLLRQLRGRWTTLVESEQTVKLRQEAATYLSRLAPHEHIQGRELRLLQQMTAGSARPTLSEEGVPSEADPKKALKDLDKKIRSLSARTTDGGDPANPAKVSRAEVQVFGAQQPMKTGTFQGIQSELRAQRDSEAQAETLAQRPEPKTHTMGSRVQGNLSEVVQNRTTLPFEASPPERKTVVDHQPKLRQQTPPEPAAPRPLPVSPQPAAERELNRGLSQSKQTVRSPEREHSPQRTPEKVRPETHLPVDPALVKHPEQKKVETASRRPLEVRKPEPGPSQPKGVEVRKPEPGPSQPKAVEVRKPEPGPSQPKGVEVRKPEPGPIQPKAVEVRKPEPGPIQPKTVDARKPEVGPIQPKAVDLPKPDPVQPKTVEVREPEPGPNQPKTVDARKPEVGPFQPKAVDLPKPDPVQPKTVDVREPEPRPIQPKVAAEMRKLEPGPTLVDIPQPLEKGKSVPAQPPQAKVELDPKPVEVVADKGPEIPRPQLQSSVEAQKKAPELKAKESKLEEARPEDAQRLKEEAPPPENKPLKALRTLAPLTTIKAATLEKGGEARTKYPEWLQVKLSEDATPAYMTSLPGMQRGPKPAETQPLKVPQQSVDALSKTDYRRTDELREITGQQQRTVEAVAQPAPPATAAKAAQLFQSVVGQGLMASQKPVQDGPKTSEPQRRSVYDEDKDRDKGGIPPVAAGGGGGVPGAGRISGKSEIIEARGPGAVLSGSVGKRDGAESGKPSLPNLAAGWGATPPPDSDAKLSNGRSVTAESPIYSPALDDLAARLKQGKPLPLVPQEREKPRPLFFDQSEDHHSRLKEDDSRLERLEKSGTLVQAFHQAEASNNTKKREETSHQQQHAEGKLEEVSDQSSRGGGGGGGQQRERDQQQGGQGGQGAQHLQDQQQFQSQRRTQSDTKMELQRLEAYRIAKTDEALKLGLRMTNQPEGKHLSELMNRHAGHNMESLLKKAYRLDSLGELSRDDAVNALGLVLKMGGEFTFAHSARVLELAMDLADEVGVSDKKTRSQVQLGALLKDTGEMALMLDEAPPGKLEKMSDWLGSQDLRQAGLLHDIGKTRVPPEILYKPGKLTEEEYEVMKLHPIIGEQMVYPIESLRHLCPVIRGHHEKWDGSGYPDGLKGEAIPYGARILAIADVFDALHAERPYKAGMPVERVQAILREGRGSHFDPDLLDAFERVIQRRHPELSNPFA